MTTGLDRLLRPKSVAILGGGWAGNVAEQCRRAGFSGDVWPVHPRHEQVHGYRCYPSLDELPGVPDAVFIGVNRNKTIEIVQQLKSMGAGGAVCFASGFSEAQALTEDGNSLQQALIDAAGDMPVLGPNCYGLINYLDGALLWPDQHGGRTLGPDGKGVAIVMQSSNIAINCTMAARGLPLAYVLCAGNQAVVDIATMVDGLISDPRVTAIGMHIEGISDVAAFEQMSLRARDAGKPLIAMKVGRSEQAREASLSHTASVAGSDAASRAFFSHLGIPVVDSLTVFLETLKLLHVHGALPGCSISSMSCSGGEASLIADLAEDNDVVFRPLEAAEKSRVKDTLSELVVAANPLDYHTFIWGDEDAMANTFGAMVSNGFDLSLLVIDFPRNDRGTDRDWDPAVRAISRVAKESGERVAIVTSLPENLPETRAEEFLQAGIAPLYGLDDSLKAISVSASVGNYWHQPRPKFWNQATDLSQSRASGNTPAGLLNEHEAKQLLTAAGVKVPKNLCVTSTTCDEAAQSLRMPLVAKALGLAHKSEHDALRLDLKSSAELQTAVDALGANGEPVLVEEMIGDCVVEFIIGVQRDPVYGHLMTIGAGGVLVELLDDVRTLRMPATEAQLRVAIESLRVAPMFAGYRGKPAASISATIETALAVQAFTNAHSDRLIELDLNPVIVTPDSAIAVDALLRFS